MGEHTYTPEQALSLLLAKLSDRSSELATQVRVAIDIGKDIWEKSPSRNGKTRWYRKSVPFSEEEALQVAIDVLQAYFVEQPMFVDSSADEFAKAALGHARQRSIRFPTEIATDPLGLERELEREQVDLSDQGVPKAIEIELQTETQISRTNQEMITLKRMSPEAIKGECENIRKLREFLTFEED